MTTPAKMFEELTADLPARFDLAYLDTAKFDIDRTLGKPTDRLDPADCISPDLDMRITFRRHLMKSGIPSTSRLRLAMKTIYHVFETQNRGVLQFPCGSGKTTVATAYIASKMFSGEKFLFVLPDRKTCTDAHSALCKLGLKKSSGLYLGWNSDECKRLSGREYKFYHCFRGSPDSRCLKCRARNKCGFFQSWGQMGRQTVVMTLASFLVHCERDTDFRDRAVIVDEDIQIFSKMEIEPDDLKIRHKLDTSGVPHLRNLFKTLLAHDLEDYLNVRYFEPEKLFPKDSLRASIRENTMRYRNREYSDSEMEFLCRLMLFLRSSPGCGAGFAVHSNAKRITIKKSRIDLTSYSNFRKFFVLNASATVSNSGLKLDTRLFRCPRLERMCLQARCDLLVVKANPFMSKRGPNSLEGMGILKRHICKGDRILVAANSREKSGKFSASTVAGEISKYGADNGLDLQVKIFPRGMFRSTNDYREFNAVFLVSAGLFTDLDDLLMTLALKERSDMPIRLIKDVARPAMYKGDFKDDRIQEIYMNNAIAEMHQALFRSCLRDGRKVKAVVALPSPTWLAVLRELMNISLKDAVPDKDKRMFEGFFSLVSMKAGSDIDKRKAAETLGYSGEDPWHTNREHLSDLLLKHFEIKTHKIVRK